VADPMATQIVDEMVDVLEAIVGDGGTTYHHKAARVVRAAGFTSACLDESIVDGAIYVLVPGESERSRPGAMGGVRLSELPVDIVIALRFTDGDDPFNPPDPTRWDVQDQLLKDAEKALLASDVLNGRSASQLAINVDIVEKDRSPENTFVEGWAVAFMAVRVMYQATEAAP
jgi:hypothetical protein